MTNEVVLKHYFDLVEATLDKYGLRDKPDCLWNVDETAINTELSSQRVVAATGKRHIYNMTYADRGENSTLVGSCSASGRQGPSLIVMKGKRMDPKWIEAMPENCEISMSKRGWITNELFLYWFK
jgi:DDE superfamily endonuclease